MEPATLGIWIFVVLGAFMILCAMIRWLFTPTTTIRVILIFGILLLGIGTYGLGFIKPYLDIIKPFTAMVEDSGLESFRAIAEKIGDGKMPPAFAQAASSYISDQSVAGTDTMLKEVIAKTPTQKTTGIKILKQTQASIERKNQQEQDREILAKGYVDLWFSDTTARISPRPGSDLETYFDRLGQTTKPLFLKSLQEKDPAALRKANIDIRVLEKKMKSRGEPGIDRPG